MGEFFGQAIVVFYILTILKYAFKLVSKYFRTMLLKYKQVNIIYKKIMIIVMKSHNTFGFLTILFIFIHFFIEFISRGLNITGLIAAITMLAQVLLGIYGVIVKKRSKLWIFLHRFIAIIILIAILIHTS